MVVTPADHLLRTSAATIAGVVGSLGLVAAIWAAEEIRTGAGVEVAAVTLAVCYATYVGVALTRGRPREIQVENAILGPGLILVGLGLWHRPEWIALGWALHGGWDLLHRRKRHRLGVEGVPPCTSSGAWSGIPFVAVGILLVL